MDSEMGASQATSQSSEFEYPIQPHLSSYHVDPYDAHHITRLLDIQHRSTIVGEYIFQTLFPDRAFSFLLNDNFIQAIEKSCLSNGRIFDTSHFTSGEVTLQVFLNRMISTIACVVQSSGQPCLKDFRPLRYFDICETAPVKGSSSIRKPELMLVRLIDGRTRADELGWHQVQAFVEVTRENPAPIETIIAKNNLTFCNQPERDFLINICITGTHFFVVVTDHSGTIETDLLSFKSQNNTTNFLRLIMGLAFLPDKYLGLDPTMTCYEEGQPFIAQKFEQEFPAFPFSQSSLFLYPNVQPERSISNLLPSPNEPREGMCRIKAISIGETDYPVSAILSHTKTLIGRATKVYLVFLVDGTMGVLKDSWIPVEKSKEADLLAGHQVPFCSELVNLHVLRKTSDIRTNAYQPAMINEVREKRRVVTYPAGVHISDFTCLWELIVAFMDVVIGVLCLEERNMVHRDISYTNILLRSQGQDTEEKKKARDDIIQQLGLSTIDKMRKDFRCREGLLVDFDHAARLIQDKEKNPGNEDQTEQEFNGDKDASGMTQATQHPSTKEVNQGGRTGTRPFMAIEVLCMLSLIVLSMI